MGRKLFALLASVAVVALVPTTALALARHHHRGHHRSREHHARVRHEHWGSDVGQAGNQTEQNAGTVMQFTPDNNGGGVLTISVNNSNNNGTSTVTGNVTPATELKCEAGESSSMRSHDDGPSGGDDQGGDNNPGDDDGQGDDQGEDQGENEQMCGTGSLIKGAVVHEAELNVSSAGAIWKEVDLVTG